MLEGAGFILATLFSGICLISLFLSLRALFPSVLLRTQIAADRSPGRSLVVGLVNFLFFGSIVFGFVAISDGTGAQFFLLPAIVIAALLSIGLIFGLAAMAGIVGERLLTTRGRRRQTIWGSAIIILGSLTPLIGWFGLFPYLAMVGLGAFIIGWFRRRPLASDDETQEAS